MPELFAPLLFLHVLGAIVALGPAFVFPVIAAMGAREPQHANFATRITQALDERVVLPVVLFTAITGVGLIWVLRLPVLDPAYRWLQLAIVLYAATFAFSWLVQRPAVMRLVRASADPQPALSARLVVAGAAVAAAVPSAPLQPAAGGPPPAVGRAAAEVGRNGMVLTLLSLAQILLMVVKPSLGA